MSACLHASLAYKQVRARVCLKSARARVHVLVVMSHSVSVSTTSVGPQEMLAPYAVLLFLFLLLIVTSFGEAVRALWSALWTTRAHESWGVAR